MNQPNLFEARKARDAGIAKVRSKNSDWIALAVEKLSGMRGTKAETTGEHIRLRLLSSGIGQPSSPHAYGALMNLLVRRGIIEDTGRVTQMFTEKSHARRTPIWRFT